MPEDLIRKNYKCWPEGIFKQLNYPEVPVFELLRSSARQWPERNAVIFGGMEMTYRELDNLSGRFATALADMGVKKGDRVGLHLPNCAQFAIAYFGLLKAGAIFVPLSPLLSERELDFELNDAGVETFVGLDLLFGSADLDESFVDLQLHGGFHCAELTPLLLEALPRRLQHG